MQEAIFTKELIKLGNSVGLTIPLDVKTAMHLIPGDLLEVKIKKVE